MRRNIKVLMDGALSSTGVMETFIERQITTLRANFVDVYHFPIDGKRGRIQNLCNCWLKTFLPRLIDNSRMRELLARVDIIHFQWPAHLLKRLHMVRHLGKPVVLSLRGRQISIVPFMPGQEVFRQRMREALPLCAAYHCVSEAILGDAEQLGLVRSRAKVIRPAIDPAYFIPCQRTTGSSSMQIAMVGGFIWRKGYEYALMAFRRLLDRIPGIRLVLVGDGEEAERITYTSQDLGIANRISLSGRLDPEGVRRVLWESDIFLHASLSEGIANVTLEAMACGLPVVATDAGGMREAIDDGVNGFLVPLRDTKAMGDRIALLAGDSGLRARMGQFARYRVVRDFDLKDQGRNFVQLYHDVLSRNKSCIS